MQFPPGNGSLPPEAIGASEEVTNPVRVKISAAAIDAVGADVRVAAHASRESLFLYVATSMLITDFDTADYFDHTGSPASSQSWISRLARSGGTHA